MCAPLGNEPLPIESGKSASLLPEIPEVYAHFSSLIALAKERFGGELGGKLLLYRQLDAPGAVVALAANIAGAATLGVDSDSERLRQGIRHGFCDFVVNNLDEALRILKNEVRKKQPVSVCLEGDLARTMRQAVERGLQPDLLALPETIGEVKVLIERGAVVLDAEPPPDPALTGVKWTAESAPAVWLARVDAIAAKVLSPGDARRRWLKFAPRYLGRTMAACHYLRMTVAELEAFSGLVESAMASGELGTKVTIRS